MGLHNIKNELNNGEFPVPGATATGLIRPQGTVGYISAYGTTVPTDATVGFCPGCIFTKTNATTTITTLYVNKGTYASCSFKSVNDPAQVAAAGFTVPSAQTLAVTTADLLTVGGIIVPQEVVVAVPLIPIAAVATRELFYAQTNAWTVTGIVTVMSVAEGTGSVVATYCKVTGNNVAVGATTPLVTATVAMTTTAGTPVVSTLTSTGADLALAATNKIGVIFSGGDSVLDTGLGMVYIKMKRS